jgi:hypothetical protein
VCFLVTTLSDPGYLPRQSAEALAAQRAAAEESGLDADALTTGGIAKMMLGGGGGGGGAAGGGDSAGFTTCSVCNVARERGTAHCYDCARCVLELDHHCPWSSKCIGAGNIRFFNAFIATLCVHSVFTAGALLTFLVSGNLGAAAPAQR